MDHELNVEVMRFFPPTLDHAFSYSSCLSLGSWPYRFLLFLVVKVPFSQSFACQCSAFYQKKSPVFVFYIKFAQILCYLQ